MDTLSYKTKSTKPAEVKKEWLVIDAKDEILGRLATKVAYLLRGKHKASYTPHVDCGDNVIIINADKIRLSGKKLDSKEYIRHSGYPGGQTRIVAKDMMKKKPFFMVEKAVKGMLPKNKLGAQLFRNLYVYAGEEHSHAGQQPKVYTLDNTLKTDRTAEKEAGKALAAKAAVAKEARLKAKAEKLEKKKAKKQNS